MTEERPTNRSGIPQWVYWERERRQKAQQQNPTPLSLMTNTQKGLIAAAVVVALGAYLHPFRQQAVRWNQCVSEWTKVDMLQKQSSQNEANAQAVAMCNAGIGLYE